MTIAFFLIPKKDVAYLRINSTMRQALEKLEYHHYTAIPLLDEQGRYAGTVSEGDLLRKIKNTPHLTFDNMKRIPLYEVDQRIKISPVKIDAEMEDLVSLVITQNFVPVVDDGGFFIGIVRRREMLEYYIKAVINKDSSD